MISNFQRFFQRVVEEALAKSPNLSSSLMNPDPDAREAYLAEVVGKGLAAMFETEESSEADHSAVPARNLSPDAAADYEELLERKGALASSPDVAAHYEELLERNAAMASALGACDCWGDVAECEICLGAGKPGWARPDRRLFSTLIGPALRALKESSFDRVTVSKNHGSY